MTRLLFAACLALVAVGFIRLGTAAEPSTAVVDGLRTAPLRTWALTDARIVVAPGRVIEKGTLVLRDGKIAAVGADVAIPPDAQVVKLAGKTLYPGLIDAYSEQAAEPPKTNAGYWNNLVTPQWDLVAGYQAEPAVNKSYREAGVTTRLVAPASGLLKGTSLLVGVGEAGLDQMLVKSRVALHAKLTIPRRPRSDRPATFPGSPMGALTLVRQATYDAQWYRDAWRAYDHDRRLPRPEQNLALAALVQQIDERLPVIVDAADEWYFLRADRYGREFGLPVIVRGSGHEYRRLEAIVATGRPVIVPVNFPKAPDVSSPETALDVPLQRLMHWDLAPENPARLVKAGVKIAFTAQGLKEKHAFLPAVRRAVHRGLSADDALKALTIAPAEMFGLAERLGTLEPGKFANVVVASGDLFATETKLLETWVHGQRHIITETPTVDVRGIWDATAEVAAAATKLPLVIRLYGDAAKPSGTIEPAGKPEKRIDADRVAVQDAQVVLNFEGAPFGLPGLVRLSAVISPRDGQGTWLGTGIWPDGTEFQSTAKRTAGADQATPPKPAGKTGDAKSIDAKPDAKPGAAAPHQHVPESSADGSPPAPAGKSHGQPLKKRKPEPKSALFAVNYPLGDFGRDGAPAQPPVVAFQNATVWTSGPQGTLEKATVLVRQGKIVAVGPNVQPPKDAVIVDCQGKHLSPGIIDCHTHIATDGGINEATQAITAEVRIGDFIDPDDINLYRQLAGGVTAANVLHGSANPIGGQNQVIKFRWGALPEEAKFAAAPPGIKFALGENVKQSNWGERFTTRYPQSRQGVEQIMRDAFTAAKEYRQQWQTWQRDRTGLPPRVDLELEAIAEVVEGRRWIHCHSYRQDEILAFLRTCEQFNIRVGSLQHILEGYKVADAIAKHGATASSFADWWAYKFEVYDAIPYNAALLHQAGVVVSLNSDDAELGRRLNLEAAKAMKYGRVPAVEAFKFVTLNPAKQLRVDKFVGSVEPGKDADLVVWNGSPLSVYSRCEQTWIDGRKYFDRAEDDQLRRRDRQRHAALVQRVLDMGADMLKTGEPDESQRESWPRHDEYCHHHDDDE